jgi:hypothetical protein
VHEGIDAGVIGFVGTRAVYEAARNVGSAATFILSEKCPLNQRTDEPRLVHQVLGRELIPRRKNPLPDAILTPQCRDHAMTRS